MSKSNTLFLYAALLFLVVFSITSCVMDTKKPAVQESFEHSNVVIDLPDITKKGILTVLAENSSTSYFIYKGKKMGFEYEILKIFADNIGVNLEMKIVNNLDSLINNLNDGMGDYVASEVVKCMIKKDININGSNTLILGITFKENCPDVRNTKAIDVVNALKSYGTNITIYDPWANEEEVMHEYGMISSKKIPDTKFDAVVLTVAHNKFMNLDFSLLMKDNAVIYDVKNFLKNDLVDGNL